MKEYRKEIISCIIALATAGWAIWFFTRSLQQEKAINRIDLYSIVATDAYCFLQINRPALFTQLWKEFPSIESTTEQYLPPFFRMWMEKQPGNHSSLLSFHSSGMIYYTARTDKEKKEIENNVLSGYFPSYSPQTYEKYGILFTYYPDRDNRFLGYFYSKGILVASYSRKLLEEVARNLVTEKNSFPQEALSQLKLQDPHTPANLLLNSNLFHFFFEDEENNNWSFSNQWIGGDLFMSEGNICFFSTFPYSTVPKQWADTLFTSLTKELDLFLPGLSLQQQLQTEENSFLYTICSSVFTKTPVPHSHR